MVPAMRSAFGRRNRLPHFTCPHLILADEFRAPEAPHQLRNRDRRQGRVSANRAKFPPPQPPFPHVLHPSKDPSGLFRRPPAVLLGAIVTDQSFHGIESVHVDQIFLGAIYLHDAELDVLQNVRSYQPTTSAGKPRPRRRNTTSCLARWSCREAEDRRRPIESSPASF